MLDLTRGCSGKYLACTACLMLTLMRAAAEDAGATNRVGTATLSRIVEGAEALVADPGYYAGRSIDTVQDSASSRMVSLVRWVDSFFNDPEYTEEEADARASLNQTVVFYRNLEPDYNTRIRASVALPNLDKRFRLSFEGNDAYDGEAYANDMERTLSQSTRGSVDDPSVRLQYLFVRRPSINLGMSGGLVLSDAAVYAGPRLKLAAEMGYGWDAKYIHRVYWYTTNNLKSKSELRFDHLLGERNLFRQAVRMDWDEEKHAIVGIRHTFTTSITQPLWNTSAIRYAWSSVYGTRPVCGWDSTTLSVGYRQGVWRKWIIVEAAPFVTWEEKYDWDPGPGIAFSVSTIFGTD